MESDAAKQILSLYEKHADEFARLRLVSYLKKVAGQVYTATSPGGHILDIGCGNGKPIAEYFIAAALR
jgi:2-polyprenyl-3-methyl-5-hydroxy-6-metoxy-1,4-benzoquinol methylase